MINFNELNLDPKLLSNLEKAGYKTPTPIQAQAIPHALQGHDILGIAQTGTGKTAAFSLPILNYILNNPKKVNSCEPRVLILAPTRELCSQIRENILAYAYACPIKSAIIFGGVGQANQVRALKEGLDICIATPGRLIDLMNQGYVRFSGVEIFVLDEADRMLDMGFINDIKKVIAKLPAKKQTLFFSATMPTEIIKLTNQILHNPKKIEVTPPATTAERISQKIIFCKKTDKYQLLKKIILDEKEHLILVFTRTKHGANKIVDYLHHFKIPTAAIHGNKSQTARETALQNFKDGKIKVLIATDIAARGIDVDGISHVVNYDLPVDAESYVHRIGRTARAGKDGVSISFCDDTEMDALKRIEKTIKMEIPKDKYIGVPEASVKFTKRHVDPRSQRAQQTQTSHKNEPPKGKPKIGFKFRNRNKGKH
jgi:ATP-dependent RNA helicase RhlE